jgi:hypothetical protein
MIADIVTTVSTGAEVALVIVTLGLVVVTALYVKATNKLVEAKTTPSYT